MPILWSKAEIKEGIAMSERRLKHHKNHSSKSEQTTRVKSRKKKLKKTVGITISPRLLAEARKHKLNISRITEQALASILEYIRKENESESSKYFLSRGSFLKESRAGSSVWYERRLRKAEVAGSNPARSTTFYQQVFLIT